MIKHKLHLSPLFCCNHTCNCVNMVSVTSASRYITTASRYYPRYQSRPLMYIRGLVPWNNTELAEAVPIVTMCVNFRLVGTCIGCVYRAGVDTYGCRSYVLLGNFDTSM